MKITKRKDGRYTTSVQFNGKRKYFIGTDDDEVKARAIEYINFHNKGVEMNNENITIAKLSDEWFELKQKKNTKKTQIEVKRLIDNYIKADLGLYQVKHLKPLHIQKMLNKMMDKGLTTSVKKVYQIIHSILEFAVDNDYCMKNVSKGCTYKQFKAKEKQILSKEDISALENSKNKYRDFFVFILYSGLRRGEIAGLKWSDIDFKSKEIHVCRSMSFVSNQGELKATKTNKVRTIPLLDKTLEILQRQPIGEYVFSKQDGKHLTESAIDRMHESILKDTGLNFKLHELRHTFCTILYYAGVSSIHAAQIMGHSLAVMQEIYTHLDKEKAKEEVAKLNKYILEN